jgi:hypothetical protein
VKYLVDASVLSEPTKPSVGPLGPAMAPMSVKLRPEAQVPSRVLR